MLVTPEMVLEGGGHSQEQLPGQTVSSMLSGCRQSIRVLLLHYYRHHIIDERLWRNVINVAETVTIDC